MSGKRIDIRWRDLDAFGHVNQAVYQTYLEESLDHWLRRVLGLADGEVWDYVAARVAIDYRTELNLADRQVVGTCALRRVGNTSVTVAIELRAPDGRLAAEAETVIVKREAITDDERSRLEAA